MVRGIVIPCPDKNGVLKKPFVVDLGSGDSILTNMQKYVEGWIDVFRVPYRSLEFKGASLDAIVNDEGKLIGLPLNITFMKMMNTLLESSGNYMTEDIVGTVVLCSTDFYTGDTIDIPNTHFDYLLSLAEESYACL